jgi:diguanylate cyclase (GGDEF)-like protein
MAWFERQHYPDRTRANRLLDAFFFLFSYYAAPVAIGVVSVLVLIFSTHDAQIVNSGPLPMRVLGDTDNRLSVAAGVASLLKQPLQQLYSTHLSEKPVWFEVATPLLQAPTAKAPVLPAQPIEILLPSKHIRQIDCFDGSTLLLIGSVSATGTSTGALTRSGGGVAVDVGSRERIVCRAIFSGPAALSASWVSTRDLKRMDDLFHRRAGLLEGGLATLAAFILITAVINRDWVYVLFAAWLFGNLRLGAISMGWDDQWFGFALPLQWVSLIRKVTVPVYYILTYALFQALFRNNLARIGYDRLLRVVQSLGPVLLVASVVLPVPIFLPVMWTIVSFGIAVVVFLLARMLVLAPSRTVLWYGAALATILISTFSEVASAAFEKSFTVPTLNSVTAALVSSLMAALAIAEQIRVERAQRLQAQAELSNAYEISPVGLFTLGADGSFVRFNSALIAMLDMGHDIGRHHWDDYFPAGSWRAIYRRASELGTAEIELSRTARLADGDHTHQPLAGSRVSLGGSSTKLEDAVAQPIPDGIVHQHFIIKTVIAGTQLEGSVQDITERQQALDTLRFLAEHDPLTGALNRRGIDTRIEEAMTGAQCASARPMIAYLDLDRFKLINDLYGHHVGDEVLRQVCQRIEQRLAPADFVCRVGGDEFIILFRYRPIDLATALSQTIVNAIGDEPYQIGSRAFHVRASLGLIEAPAGMRAQEIISAADSACRQAKRGGSARVVAYSSDAGMFEERARELSLIESFSGELPLAGLYLEMQPIMSLRAPYATLDFEVLLRMRGPDGANVPPSKVISAAEANGTISALDRWVIETTLHWVQSNRLRLSRTDFVSVNVSAASLNDERFVAELETLFRQYSQAVELVCVEITEGVALHDLNNTRRLIDRAQRLGARVALDDFGSGYTSFHYLLDLPADALKVDGEFVRNIHVNPANAAIVEAAIGLARNLGMQSIAEWAEDAQTLELLQTMGADYVQGFAIARPQKPEKILAATSAADFIEDPQVLALIGPRPASHRQDQLSSETRH